METHSGWIQHFDAVASNADIMHSYRDLLATLIEERAMQNLWPRNDLAPVYS